VRHGPAVTVRRGLVVRGGARLFGVSRVEAVKALRGMSRLCDVRLGKVRQSWQSEVKRGELWRDKFRRGMAAELWLVWERFGTVRQVMDWRGSHVWVRKGVSCTGESKQGSRGEVRYVAVNRGMAGHVKAVTAS